MRRRVLNLNKRLEESFEPFSKDFRYTSAVLSEDLEKGTYLLQCWGAQGGSINSYSGGKGGYSEGIITLSSDTTVYIFVGGAGNANGNGGWNCGGGGSGHSSYNSGDEYGESYYGGGGGATDIALVTSSMSYSSYITNRSAESLLSRIIVAGGGSGAASANKREEVSDGYYYSIFSSNSGVLWFTVTDPNTYTEFGSEFYITEPVYFGDSIIIYYNNPNTSYGLGRVQANYTDGTYSRCSDFLMPYSGIECEIGFNLDTSKTLRSLTLFIRISAPTPTDAVIEDMQNNFYVTDVEKWYSNTYTDSSSAGSNGYAGGGTNGKGYSSSLYGKQNSAGSNGSFGKGGGQSTTNYRYLSGCGGGGWYGGGSSYSDSNMSTQVASSGGGSGFVNIAANAGNRPSNYTGLQLDSGTTYDGGISFEAPSGGKETGHSGDGYARITRIDPSDIPPPPSYTINWDVLYGQWNLSSNSNAYDGIQYTCISPGSDGSTTIRCTIANAAGKTITFIYRSDAESTYDYLAVGNLDTECTRNNNVESSSGRQNLDIEYSVTITDNNPHFIEFCYSKDGSVDTQPDNGTVYLKSII